MLGKGLTYGINGSTDAEKKKDFSKEIQKFF